MSESTHIDVRTDDESQDDEKTKGKNIYTHKSYGPEHVVLIVNFILELLSAAFDQISSVHKPQFALLSMLMSFLVFIICAADYAKKISKLRGKFVISNPENFGFVSDTVGLICSFFQCVFSSIAYAFLSRHANNPIKINVLPIVFAYVLLFSKLPHRRRRSRKSTEKVEPESETVSSVNHTELVRRKIRLVKCPNCGQLVPDAPGVLDYRCGFCGAVVEAKFRKQIVATTTSSLPGTNIANRNQFDHVFEDDESTSSSDDGTELAGMNLSIDNHMLKVVNSLGDHNNRSHKTEFEQLGISGKGAGGEPNLSKLPTTKSAPDIVSSCHETDHHDDQLPDSDGLKLHSLSRSFSFSSVKTDI